MTTHFASRRAHKTMLVGLIAALAIFWLAASQITKSGMTGWEKTVFDAVYNLPLRLQPLFVAITQAGSVLMIAGVLIVLLITRHRLYAVRVLFLSAITYGLAMVAKYYFARPRPNVLLQTATQRGVHELGFGFPSAHAAISMALGIALLPLLPRKTWWLVFVLVFLVGTSRVYLGVHSPLDVIGGFALGAATSLSYLLFVGVRQNKHIAPKRVNSVKSKTSPKR